LRIAIDGYIAGLGQSGFISYISRLATSLSELPYGDEVVLLVPSEPAFDLTPLVSSTSVEVAIVEFCHSDFVNRADRDTAWLQYVLPQALVRVKPDVLLGPTNGLPRGWPGPKVVTVHDVLFKVLPQYSTPDSVRLYEERMAGVLALADRIITVSHSVASDLEKHFSPQVAVDVVHLAPSIAGRADVTCAAKERVATELGVKESFMLSVSPIHARKNLEGTLRAFAELPVSLRAGMKLVLAWVPERIAAPAIDDAGLSGHVVYTERLTDETLADLYSAADLLLFPSFGEGFGLPIVEAMHSGTPVIAGDNTAMPEVSGGAGLLVNPHSPEDITQAIARVLTEPGLRDSLVAAGLSRAEQFSWRATAEATRRSLLASLST